MTGHAMKYAKMAESVAEDLASNDPIGFGLVWNAKSFVRAESEMVKTYGRWRTLMEEAAKQGSTRAAEYLERTTWDLT